MQHVEDGMADAQSLSEQLLARFRPFAHTERREQKAVIFTLPFGTEIRLHPDGDNGVTIDIMAPISVRALTLDEALTQARDLSLLAAHCDDQDLETLMRQQVNRNPEHERVYNERVKDR